MPSCRCPALRRSLTRCRRRRLHRRSWPRQATQQAGRSAQARRGPAFSMSSYSFLSDPGSISYVCSRRHWRRTFFPRASSASADETSRFCRTTVVAACVEVDDVPRDHADVDDLADLPPRRRRPASAWSFGSSMRIFSGRTVKRLGWPFSVRSSTFETPTKPATNSLCGRSYTSAGPRPARCGPR